MILYPYTSQIRTVITAAITTATTTTGNDKDTFRPGGEIYEAMKSAAPDSVCIDEFKDVVHGWTTRGDVSDPAVDSAVKLALQHLTDFFAKHTVM
jgi:hypothetical protein